ncbi:hypothetical protein H5410_061891 [Solanum commersonii]|uniref:Uncharacterized protein n=1 Tax=Solanum commersonii TaxID=4109 RepID=A0A9J5W964_SOLCO|nr:hypothetical protein H5410_061891 [Solanum commersonii]
MQYRSSTELANQFKIKREQLDNERNDKAKKEHAPIAHKRKNSEDFIPQQGKSKLLEYKSVIHSSSRKELEEQHDIQDLLNFKQVKRKSVLLATSSDQFLEEQRLQKEHDIHDLLNYDETKTDNHKVTDDLVDQEEISGDECAIDEEIGIDCGSEGILELKKVRGKTTCKDIHARNLEERKKVTFDKGQVVGPTVEGKKWVMTSLRDAWRRYKQKIKERYFDKNSTVEDMLAKRPYDMPEEQFRQLIKKKQKWRHRMGPMNFARVCVALHATKENNEELSKSEMFIATRTKMGKDLHTDTQVAIVELQNCQNFREITDDAFTVVFGKEQPGRIKCYGRSVTTSSLKKDEETKS